MTQAAQLIVAALVVVAYFGLVFRRPARPDDAVSPAERLFAMLVCLAFLMLAARQAALHLYGGIGSFVRSPGRYGLLLALAPYQDALLVGVLAWVFCGLCAAAPGRALGRVAYAVGFGLCIGLAAYVTLSTMILETARLSISYQIISTPGFFGEVRRSLIDSVTVMKLLKIVLAPLTVALAASIICSRIPGLLRRTWRAFFSPLGAALLATYFVIGSVAWANTQMNRLATSNSVWGFVSASMRRRLPTLTDQFPSSYFDDFAPSAAGSGERAATQSAANRPIASKEDAPLNVVLVVMESVGARSVQLFGAPYDSSPQLIRLSNNAATFSRIYTSDPWSSDAMVGLVCSVYAYQYWGSTTRWFPNLRIPSLPQALAQHGYRTGFLHSSDIYFDLEGQFLQRHGFGEVLDSIGFDRKVSALASQTQKPRDTELFSAATRWIRKDTSRPFFLMLWTQDTHAPYATVRNVDYGVGDPEQNRYLNSIRATDALIGNLADELRKTGYADNTLIVVTGDHGEAFREHGQKWHGSTVYEEEVRVPLMFVNPRLFPRPRNISTVGEQVDIAPTIMDLLGFDLPDGWQGRSLFKPSRDGRAYLFDTFYLRFGLVEGNLKYIYDADSRNAQIYDVVNDPMERNDLYGNVAYSDFAAEAHRRIAAWFAFQNPYLQRVGGTDRPN